MYCNSWGPPVRTWRLASLSTYAEGSQENFLWSIMLHFGGWFPYFCHLLCTEQIKSHLKDVRSSEELCSILLRQVWGVGMSLLLVSCLHTLQPDVKWTGKAALFSSWAFEVPIFPFSTIQEKWIGSDWHKLLTEISVGGWKPGNWRNQDFRRKDNGLQTCFLAFITYLCMKGSLFSYRT